jgi:predicted HTH transcriptional regulator
MQISGTQTSGEKAKEDQKPVQRVFNTTGQLITKESALKLLTCLLAETTLPFSFLENRIFKILLHPDVARHMPRSATTISRSLPFQVDEIKTILCAYVKVR